eukprot:TRINITY_DN10756_c0_g1_i2.p1 TRINITY_DN10756_c0_g1~~TRINITY_DN10756_c0_g1_i2.p1  ORF type:complete len:127 (-),score=50.15 TRINITY_DN10756_c0_g1_i2:73-453(-)
MIDHFFFFFLMIRRPPRSTLSSSSAASDVYKRQLKALLARLRNDISINNTPDEGVCFCAQVVLKWLECLWTNRMFPRGDAQLPGESRGEAVDVLNPVSYTHLRAHETPEHLVCRLLLEKKKKQNNK